MGRTSTLVLLTSLASTNNVLAHDSKKSLASHFETQAKSNAHLQKATHLPVSAAKPIFHMELAQLGEEQTVYEEMIEHEALLRKENEDAEAKYPFLLCGSQKTAATARSEIKEFFEERADVVYASRTSDVACWRVPLLKTQADKLADSASFFHVTQAPVLSKFAPEMINQIGDRMMIAAQALKQGINIKFESGVKKEKREELFKKWETEMFGLASGEHMKQFFPSSDKMKKSAWQAVRTNSEDGKCKSILRVALSKHSRQTDFLVRLNLDKLSGGDVDSCALSALAYLASQHEVRTIEPVPSIVLHTVVPTKNLDIHQLKADAAAHPTEVSIDASKLTIEMGVKPLNTISTTSLQSGDANQPNPFFDLNINGTGQIVEVSDTGFDDASCFFRPVGSEASLTGSLSSEFQVTRSAYDTPITDKSLRKVVQYIMRDTATAVYGYDYASGHGTHCAGTIAGKKVSGATIDALPDYYSNCGDLTNICDTYFCSTCDDPHTCDTTCGFEPEDAYNGTAPGAKLMVYDFGDASGNLDVPTDMRIEVFGPAYDEGAHIFSNSWGSSAPYNYYGPQAVNIDQFIYDSNDVLVVFAAGNSNTDYGDDVMDTGDGSVGAPAICKNVLTVGAAETAYSPDTMASFSSRGPSRDMRIKPDVCGPGNPVYSTKASGSAGLASCAVVDKSGTSMATPAVAGAAALIREILVKGHHYMFSTLGYSSSSYNEHTPTGTLMKALLIGSTSRITKGYDSAGNEVKLADFYGASTAVADSTAYSLGTTTVDYSQGFGHVRLSNVFSLDNSFETFLYDDSLGEYSTWEKLYEVTGTATEVDITLVWNDPPGDTYCGIDYEAGGCVVHDLDLKVYNQGKRVYSNFGAGDGDYAEQEDIYNNVEKVTINTTKLSVGSTIMVVVETNGLSYASYQNFSVVVTGVLGEGSPVLAPTPSPTTATAAPTTSSGNCYSADSMVKVLVPGSLHASSVDTKLANVRVGDRLLSRSTKGQQVFATVKGLPHSASDQPFVHITMASPDAKVSHNIKATPHHTFPTCTGQLVEARKVKKGHCLWTVDGERHVKEISKIPLEKLGKADEITYTLVMEEHVESVAVGGVFTHARSEGGHTHADLSSQKHITSTMASISKINEKVDATVKTAQKSNGIAPSKVSFSHPRKVHPISPKAAAN